MHKTSLVCCWVSQGISGRGAAVTLYDLPWPLHNDHVEQMWSRAQLSLQWRRKEHTADGWSTSVPSPLKLQHLHSSFLIFSYSWDEAEYEIQPQRHWTGYSTFILVKYICVIISRWEFSDCAVLKLSTVSKEKFGLLWNYNMASVCGITYCMRAVFNQSTSLIREKSVTSNFTLCLQHKTKLCLCHWWLQLKWDLHHSFPQM